MKWIRPYIYSLVTDSYSADNFHIRPPNPFPTVHPSLTGAGDGEIASTRRWCWWTGWRLGPPLPPPLLPLRGDSCPLEPDLCHTSACGTWLWKSRELKSHQSTRAKKKE